MIAASAASRHWLRCTSASRFPMALFHCLVLGNRGALYHDLQRDDLRTEEAKLYLFVAIVRTSKFAYAELLIRPIAGKLPTSSKP